MNERLLSENSMFLIYGGDLHYRFDDTGAFGDAEYDFKRFPSDRHYWIFTYFYKDDRGIAYLHISN